MSSRTRALAYACALAAVLACWLALPAAASAASATLLPNAVFADNANVVVNGCVAPKSQCIDEAIPGSVNDADTLQGAVAGSHAIEFDLTTTTSVYRLHAIEIRLRARCLTASATRTIGVGIFNAAGVQQGTTETFTVTDAWANHIGFVRSLALTQTDVDGLRARITTGGCSSGTSAVSALSLQATYAPLVTDEVLVPNALRSGSAGALLGCASSWTCINQTLGTGDGSYVENTVGCGGSQTAAYELTSPAYRVREVTSVRQGARAQMENVFGSSTVEAQVFWTSGNTTNYSGAVNSGGAWQTREAGATSVSLDEAQIGGAYVQVRMIMGTCVKERIADVNVKATYGRGSTISGTALDAAGGGRWSECDGSSTNVAIAVDGVVQQHVACDATTGAWTGGFLGGQDSIVTAFLDDATIANNGGATYVKLLAASSDLAGITLTKGEVRMKNESVTPISLADLAGDDVALDTDIPLTLGAGTVNIAGNATLVVAQGTLVTEDTTVTTPRIRVETGGVLDVYAGHQLVLTGSGTGACTAGTSARPLCANAAGATVDDLDVRYTGTAATNIDGGAWYGTLQLQPTAGSPTYQLGSADDASLTVRGDIVIGSGAHAVTASTTTFSPRVEVAGEVVVQAAATLSGSGTDTLHIALALRGGGDVHLTDGSVSLGSASTSNVSMLDATGAGATWRFATLAAISGLMPNTVTIPATSRGVEANILFVGYPTLTFPATLTTTAMTTVLTVHSALYIDTSGRFEAPPLAILNGDAYNYHEFIPGTGTVRFAGASTSAIIADPASTGSFYDLEVVGANKVVETDSDLLVHHSLTMTGTSCAAPATLRATAPGPVRTIYNAGATSNMTFASFVDMAAEQPIDATSGGGTGTTTNITFGTPCTAPNAARVDGQDASGGLANTVAGSTAFPISTMNQMTGSADRQRTRVMSTPLDNVTGLWHLDSLTNPIADEWHAANAVAGSPSLSIDQGSFAPTTSAAGPSGHATAATFSGSDRLETPPGAATAVFDAPSFTVETWFRTSSLANGQPNPEPILVERGSWWLNRQFTLYFDQSTNTLHAAIGAANTAWDMNIGAAPYLDGAWHHVALTVVADAALPGPGEMRLYLDGEERAMRTFTGAQNTWAGITNNRLLVGEGQNGPGTKFVGDLDEIRVSSVARTAAEIRGYVATRQAHATTLWETASSTGDLLTPTCVAAARCADVPYAGPVLPDEGRWYVQQQLRTPEGLWSAWSTAAPFETRAAISVGAIPAMAFGSITPGTSATASTTATVTCGAPSGCDVFAQGYSDTVALDDGGVNSVPRHGVVEPAAPASWGTGVADGMGISVASTTSGKDTGRWGTGIVHTDTANLAYLGMTRTPSLLASSTSSGVESVVIAGRVNAPPGTAVGTYTGLMTVVAVPNL